MAENDLAIELKNVFKSFKIPNDMNSGIKQHIVGFYKRKKGYRKLETLKDVSFNVRQGEFFGIVGRNGSGKSTLLKLLAGIYTPDSGLVKVNGRLTPFIELGVGFNPELTGRENIYLNGALLGFSRKEMNEKYKEIVKFAELKKFMDQKLKNYSSGMQVRLAFSIAIQAKSEILLLDEVLAVGDAAFQKKCFAYFRKLKKEKRTVIFISHDMEAVKEYCDRAALLDNGVITQIGPAEKIALEYTKMFNVKNETVETERQDTSRWGDKTMIIKSVKTHVDDNNVTITAAHAVNRENQEPVYGLAIYSPTGQKIFESNSKLQKISTGKLSQNNQVEINWELPNIFTNGEHSVTVAVSDRHTTEFYDWWDNAATFAIDKETETSALTSPRHKIRITKKGAD